VAFSTTDEAAPAVSVEGLGKRFGPGRSRTRWWAFRRERESDDMLDPVGVEEPDDEDDEDDDLVDEDEAVERQLLGDGWAFRDVTFAVPRGSGLALVGPHGSGKSTVLRVLGRVTPPTEGRAVVRGRVAPQLQTASIFMRGDQTLEQNVNLVASFFGIPREIVRRHADAIFEFAELGGRERTKLGLVPRTFANRLAAAILLHSEPDVILVDEAISAGDPAFRERCIDRVGALLADGAALVLASHDLELVEALCDRAVWLDSGSVVATGSTAEILERFRPPAPVSAPSAKGKGKAAPADATDDASLVGVSISEGRVDDDAVDAADAPLPVRVAVEVDVAKEGILLRCGIAVTAGKGIGVRAVQPQPFECPVPGRYVATVEVDQRLLGPGLNEVRVGAEVTIDGTMQEIALPKAATFFVEGPPRRDDEGKRRLTELPRAPWTIERPPPTHALVAEPAG
jgi:ABC-type polysaccharide/polyol phosphate transport system ATPase subunit